jgi:hypothetical protein
MVDKKPKKSTNSDTAGKESDEEFLKRIAKMQEKASQKASEEIESYSKSSEVEELKATGKRAAKDLEEIEECDRISDEFKINPPVVITKHINDVSVEYRYEDAFKSKIELLKKHAYPFFSIIKSTSIFTANVRAYGKAYVKRGMQRIPLPENSNPPTTKSIGMGSQVLDPKNVGFMLQDGDRIVTDGDSYVCVNDFISNDDYHREIYIFPNSEAVMKVSEEVTHPAPGFMDPSQVPEVIKNKSECTVTNCNISGFLLVKGIFWVSLLDKNKNANNLLEFASGSPPIEFLHSSKTYESIMNKEYAKLANVPNAASIVAAYNAQKAKSKVCDEISAYIELGSDNSIVVFGTMNSVENKHTGKTTNIMFPKAGSKDFIFSGKVTMKGNTTYSDKSGNPDPRIKAVIKYQMAIGQYISLLAAKKNLEKELKDALEKKSKPKAVESEASKKDKERRKAELTEKLEYYKHAGDTIMVNATQMQIDELDPQKQQAIIDESKRQGMKELLEELENAKKAGNKAEENAIQMRINVTQMQFDLFDPQNAENIEEHVSIVIDGLNEQLAKLSPDLNTNFPPYNPPAETDAV